MVRGRRSRCTSTAKNHIKIVNMKKDVKSQLRKRKEKKTDLTIETITQRTRNLRKSLHKIQKQFDNQAITKFFQRTLKANAFNDENACDHFTAEQIANKLIDNDAIANLQNDDRFNCNQNSIQSTNIFLQKPVLHLEIDKSINQATSIVINKHLDVCANFATTFSTFNSTMLNKNAETKTSEDELNADQNQQINSSNDQHKCEKPRLRKRRPRKCATINGLHLKNGLNDSLNESDSNSCDSGVVSDRSFELSAIDGKPTTPHRIVCPSISTPTNEENANIQTKNKLNGIVKTLTKRLKGKTINKIQSLNDAKSFFTKMSVECDEEKINQIESIDKQNDVNDIEMQTMNESSVELKELPKPISRSSTPSKSMQSKQMTDFYPVRRSIRKTKKAVEQEYIRHLEKAIETQCEDGLIVKYFKEKGRGICAGRPFARGEFVVEYIGDLIEQSEADRREEIYAKDSAFGCYMYYFKHKEQQWCIDATAETGKLGRLVNHSRNGNLVTKIVTYKNQPHLVLIAKDNIKQGEELTYDYGDRTRESLVNHPWLAL